MVVLWGGRDQIVRVDKNRCRRVRINIASARSEIISSGENPRFRASQRVRSSSNRVVQKFGQAVSAHCPRQVSTARVRDRGEIRNWPVISVGAARAHEILKKVQME